MTPHAFQEQHDSTTKSMLPAAVRTRPITPQARAFAARIGDPAGWDAERLRAYIELGGAARR